MARALVASALSAVLLLGACGRGSQEPTSSAKVVALDLSPARQLDWLPANASAMVHFDLTKLRSTQLYQELAPLLPTQPPIRQVLERTESVRIAVVSTSREPQIVALFAGSYDERVNPSVLAGDSLEARDHQGVRVLEHARSHDQWFRTPEGFWLCSEAPLFDHVFVNPDTRGARLSAQAWARAPRDESLLHAAMLMSPLWRDEASANLTDPVSSSMFLPAVEELRVLTFDASGDGSGGYLLELSADFESSRGAQSAAFVVQAAILAAKTRAYESPAPATSSPASSDQAFEFGRTLGHSFASLLDELVLDVQGTRTSASLLLAAEMLEALRTQVREAAARAAQAQALDARGP